MITLRATALITAASLALHELRYVLGYGSHAHEALASQGHSYLPLAAALAAVLLALAAAHLLARLARAWRTGVGDGAPLPVGLAWLAASLALAGVYTGQELLEGALAEGHPGGLAAVTANGGLVAYPLAFALGALVALLLRGASAVLAAVARRPRGWLAPRAPCGRLPVLLGIDPVPQSRLLGCRAARGPPLAS